MFVLCPSTSIEIACSVGLCSWTFDVHSSQKVNFVNKQLNFCTNNIQCMPKKFTAAKPSNSEYKLKALRILNVKLVYM